MKEKLDMRNKNVYFITKGNISLEDIEKWNSVDLINGWILHYDNNMKVAISQNRNAVLLGTAWQVEGDETPYQQVKQFKSNTPPEVLLNSEQNWCGKYILIINEVIYTDLTASLRCFYTEDIISNSIQLISRIKKVYYNDGLIAFRNWFPGPLTPYDGIMRLLPSQILDFDKTLTYERAIFEGNIRSFESEEKRNEEFIRLFSSNLHNMEGELNGRLCLPLTGGVDSRTIFAFLVSEQIPFSAFTLEHSRIAEGDRILPGELCKKSKIDYRFINMNEAGFDSDTIRSRRRTFDDYVCGLVSDADNEFYQYGSYEELLKSENDNIIILSGAIWEMCIGSFYYRHKMWRNTQIDNMKDVEYAMPETVIKSDRRRSMKKFLELCNSSKKNAFMEDTDRWYWDQVDGVWNSDIDDAFNIYDNISVVEPLNSRTFFKILFGYDKERRYGKDHQKALIRMVCPIIGDFPYADEFQAKKKWQGKRNRFFNELKRAFVVIESYGLSECIKYYNWRITRKKK